MHVRSFYKCNPTRLNIQSLTSNQEVHRCTSAVWRVARLDSHVPSVLLHVHHFRSRFASLQFRARRDARPWVVLRLWEVAFFEHLMIGVITPIVSSAIQSCKLAPCRRDCGSQVIDLFNRAAVTSALVSLWARATRKTLSVWNLLHAKWPRGHWWGFCQTRRK